MNTDWKKEPRGKEDHHWFRTWERTGQSHAGEWFIECSRCGGWFTEGLKPIEKICAEIEKMDRDEVVRTGGC